MFLGLGLIPCGFLLVCCMGHLSPVKPVPQITPDARQLILLDPAAPIDWSDLMIKNKKTVDYRILNVAGRNLIRANSEEAASMWLRHVQFNLEDYPIVEWEWCVKRPLSGEELSRKAGNDCCARVLFGFKGDWSASGFLERRAVQEEIARTGYEPPGTLLVYVWSLELEPDTVLTDPHVGDRARVIVATSGRDVKRPWRGVRRNLLEDYRNAFGSEPPPVISVSIMTDTDDTHSTAQTDYGRIAVQRR